MYFVNILLVTIALLVTMFLLRPPRDLQAKDRIAGKLAPGRIDNIATLALEESGYDDAKFWIDSRGLAGCISRLVDLWWLMRLLQLHAAVDPALVEPAQAAYKAAAVQVWFSVWAFPESVMCSAWRSLPHISARAAAIRHVSLTYLIADLCITEDTPECTPNLY